MLRMTYSLIVIVAFSTVVSAQQVPPPGFEVADITHDPDVLYGANDLNNCGQAVYSASFERSLANTEIFLYDNGHIARITEDENLDLFPGITENGMIYWLRGEGDAPLTILMEFVDGVEIQLAQEQRLVSAAMNAAGHYAWVFRTGQGCSGADTEVAFFDGDGTIVIPGEGISRQSIKMNERDELVWNEYFFCEDPQRVDVVLYQDGVFTKLNGEEGFAFLPAINDSTQVAYSSASLEGASETRLWENGVSRTIVDPSRGAPRSNNLGDVTFGRIYPEDRGNCQVWLYSGDTEEVVPLTEAEFPQGVAAMNDYREVVISSLEFGDNSQVRLLRRIRTGDSEFDGDIDIDDLAKLVDCMTGPMWVERVNPGPQESLCECRFLDINHDGSVDLRDYALFQENFGKQP